MKNWFKILGRVLIGRFEDPPGWSEPAIEAPVEPKPYEEIISPPLLAPKKKPTLQHHFSSGIRAARSENGVKLHLAKTQSSNSPLLCGAKRDRAYGWISILRDDPRICKNCLKKSSTRRIND